MALYEHSETKIAARIDFDSDALKKDLKILSELPLIEEQYDEFRFGVWINHSLWNRSGDWTDTQFIDLDEPPIKTEVAHKLTYLTKVIEETFDMDHMTMGRIRNLVDGGVVPHIDFLEMSKEKAGYVRILLPLENCVDSYHSEETLGAFRMKKGEVWILDSQIPHTACNLNADNRRILSLDFHYSDEENPHWSRIFKDKSMIKEEDVKLSIIERAQLEAEEIDDYLELLAEKYVDTNATEVVMKKILHLHLRFDIPVTDIYTHLIRVAELTGKKELVDFAKDMRRYFMESRVLYERFLLREDLMNSAA